jgi:uncharacterized heparinase superfamily protein
MKKLTCTIFATAAALQYASAANSVDAASAMPAPAASSVEAPAVPPALELKNKSSFAIPESGRNPFWPIGWKPAATTTTANTSATTEPTVAVDPSAFVVSSIVMDPRAPFAIINGKAMTQGQVFGLQMGSSTYQMTVKAIEDGRVILVRGRDQEIVVPLRRR